MRVCWPEKSNKKETINTEIPLNQQRKNNSDKHTNISKLHVNHYSIKTLFSHSLLLPRYE